MSRSTAGSAASPAGWRGKRLFDLVLVTLSSPVWLPTLAGLATIVRVGSGAPVLFRQERMGLNGQTFVLYKFRSMDPGIDAPREARFAGWTYPGDPRTTTLGRWMRKWRLDEVPQLVNVLRGDMSLVGPRPDTPDVAAGLRDSIPGFMDKYGVLPGLTGLGQVSRGYHRFSTPEELRAKVDLDRRYARESAPLLDLWILARTPGVLARGQGVV